MKQAKCKKTMAIEMCDGDGFSIPNKYLTIKEGTIWNIYDSKARIVGGEIRLTSDKYGWIEISKESFKEHFDKLGSKIHTDIALIKHVKGGLDATKYSGSITASDETLSIHILEKKMTVSVRLDAILSAIRENETFYSTICGDKDDDRENVEKDCAEPDGRDYERDCERTGY